MSSSFSHRILHVRRVMGIVAAAGGVLVLASCGTSDAGRSGEQTVATAAKQQPGDTAKAVAKAPAPAPMLRDTTCTPRRDFGTPVELVRFVPAGSRILCAVASDLDRDSLADWVMVTEPAHDDVSDMAVGQHPRTLKVLLREPGGGLREAVRNDSAVYCYGCGGSFDPFEELEAKPGRITIYHYGGRGERWRADFTFTYAPAARTWRLTEYSSLSLHSGDPEGTLEQQKFGPDDFGVIGLAEFDPEKHLARLHDGS